MTIKELIEALEKVEDNNMEVLIGSQVTMMCLIAER